MLAEGERTFKEKAMRAAAFIIFTATKVADPVNAIGNCGLPDIATSLGDVGEYWSTFL